MRADKTDQLKQLYAYFNAREIDSILPMLHPAVTWANGMEGGHVEGHDGVREYWTRQWSKVDPHVEPTAFSTDQDGQIAVEVHQTVRDLKGDLLSDRTVRHFFRFENGLVRRFDIG